MAEKKASKKKAASRGRGQPTKYKPEYCDLIVGRAAEGASFTEFCAEIGISRQTLHNWKNTHPDFFDAYTRAELVGQAHWERKLRTELMIDRNANPALVKLYFANRFNWSDKQELDHGAQDSMKDMFQSIANGKSVLDIARERSKKD